MATQKTKGASKKGKPMSRKIKDLKARKSVKGGTGKFSKPVEPPTPD